MHTQIRLGFTIAALLLSGSHGAMAQGPGEDFPASRESPEGMLVIASEADTPQPYSIQEVVYAEREEMDLRLKIISPFGSSNMAAPNADTRPLPLVIYVQGSAWFAQDTSATIPRMADFARRSGYVIASVQYRPSTVAQAPAQLEDVKSAIRHMRANAQRFRIDPDRVAVWGDSSGGHMAALVGTTEGMERFVTGDNDSFSSQVSAVVDFYGPTDFLKMSDYPSVLDHDAPSSPESTVIGGPIQDPANFDKVQAYNPIHYISPDKDLPPFLIMHGDKDALVPFNQSVLLYEALREAGQEVTFYKVEGGGHGIRFWTPAVLSVVEEFLGKHL